MAIQAIPQPQQDQARIINVDMQKLNLKSNVRNATRSPNVSNFGEKD